MLPEIATSAWILLAIAAFIVGVAKSAMPAMGTLSVVLGAAALPARESTGVLLVMFMLGDIFALWTYFHDANWRLLTRLAPTIILGVLLGVGFLAVADDRLTAITIGAILILLIGLTFYQRAKSAPTTTAGISRTQSTIYGTLGGFTTMVANAGGPPMSLYFLAQRLNIVTFLGTSAWLFALMNLFKLPFSIGLGLITWSSLTLNLIFVPLTAVGFFLGRIVVKRIDQRSFDRVVIAATLIGAAYLIIDSI